MSFLISHDGFIWLAQSEMLKYATVRMNWINFKFHPLPFPRTLRKAEADSVLESRLVSGSVDSGSARSLISGRN